jgi:hypothetical protein
MRRLVVVLALGIALTAGLGTLPAAAQQYPSPYGYGSPYGSSYGYGSP